MSFRSASENIKNEGAQREGLFNRLGRFGVRFLDDALRGIFPDDLTLIGAYSGVGKTQLCVNIALANLEDGKRVHFIALEASEFEIERRLKYQQIANYFFSDQDRPKLSKPLNFTSWMLGEFEQELEKYETYASSYCEKAFSSLFTFYKTNAFNVAALIENVQNIENETDLIIIDHVHYFDWDSDNDNKAVKEIAKTVRSLSLESQKPIILVSHLRKKDRNNKELGPSLDEFHGSSDLYKIATKVITVASGGVTDEGKYITYIRIPKNRIDGGVTRYLGRCTFNPRLGGYDDEYKIGWANAETFVELAAHQIPFWADRGGNSSVRDNLPSRQSRASESVRLSPTAERLLALNQRD